MSEETSNLPAAPGPVSPAEPGPGSPTGPADPSPSSPTGPAGPGPGAAATPPETPQPALVPRQASRTARRVRRRVPVLGDGDHNFEAVQHKLAVAIEAMAAANAHLEGLDRRARATATEASKLADHIADAELDPVFVEMTQEVATAQSEAAKAVRLMLRSAQQVEKSAEIVRRTHAKLYGPLHGVRRGRRWRTPKPGFFQR